MIRFAVMVYLSLTGHAASLSGLQSCGINKLAGFSRTSQTFSWNEVVRNLEALGLSLLSLPDTAPAVLGNQSIPFGTVRFKDRAFDYSTLPSKAKKLNEGTTFYYGKAAASRAEADSLVRTYFTRGVWRNGSGYHYDVHAHQSDSDRTAASGFSNGSESFETAREFAREQQRAAGVVFVCDVAGQEILNVGAYKRAVGLPIVFAEEREILIKGGRDPRTVRAAIVFERGRPVAFYTNPNFVEPGN